MKPALLVFACTLVASAQIGQPYPGGGRIPSPGIPSPRRSKGSTSDGKTPQVLPSFFGKLKRLDNKSVVIELDDYRVLDFRRTDKTKFIKAGQPAEVAAFKVGDRVSVEGSEAPDASLTAVNVYWEKQAEKGAGDAPGNLTQAELDAAEKAQERAQEKSTTPKPPEAKPDPDDPGPPKLQRGKPPAHVSPAQRDPDEEKQVASAKPGPALPGSQPAASEGTTVELPKPPSPERVAPSSLSVERLDGSETSSEATPIHKDDALIKRAQEMALEFTETLPNYVCQEMITRFQSESQPVDWRALDLVSIDLVYENGKEDYRNIKVGGKLTKKKIDEIGGSWSTGEFGTVLIDLFSPATAAEFRYRNESRVAGIMARRYDYSVPREHSHWLIVSGSQRFQPAYKGSVWVDPKTARVLRIERQARNLPEEFPLDKVEATSDYEYVKFTAVQQFLLPVHAEMLSCQRGTPYCSRNVIEFRNYHKYAGESNIQFEHPK